MTDQRNIPATSREAGRPSRRPLEEAAGWIARLEAGDLTEAEQADFEAWKSADPANAEAYRKVAAVWNSGELAAAAKPRPESTPARANPYPRQFGALARVAAMMLVFVAMAVGYSQFDRIAIALEADHRTAVGEQTSIDLPDGSRIVLNSGTAVDVAYEDARRHVRLLAGEAFFEVAHDPDRPFDVTGGDASVRVLGTTFTVRAEKDAATVTVLEGRVAVSGTAEPDQPSQLTAGERIRISDGSPGVTTRIDPAMAFAWIEGRLIFRDRPLGEVVEELGRYHSGWIVIANNQLRSHAVSGNYRLEDPVTTAAALANAASADVIRVTDYLTILH